MTAPSTPIPRGLRLVAGAIAIALAPLTAACAARPPSRTLAEAHAGAYVYHHPQLEVAGAVRALLLARGFEPAPTPRGEVVQTSFRIITDDEEWGDAYQSYRVVVHRLTREHSRVTATLITLPSKGLSVLHPRANLRDDGMGRNINTVELGKAGKPSPLGKARAVRDLDFEWELVRRLDPARARQIDAMVAYELTHAR